MQHHAITDGTSLGILSRDFAAAYGAALHNSQPRWQPLSVAYVDYAAWQRSELAGDALEAELEWWRQTLAGAPALLELPTDRPRPGKMTFSGDQVSFSTPGAVRKGLLQLATAQQTTPFVVMLAALQASAREPGLSLLASCTMVDRFLASFSNFALTCHNVNIPLVYDNACCNFRFSPMMQLAGAPAQVHCTGRHRGGHAICQP